MGSATDVEIRNRNLKKTKDKLNKMLAEFTGKSLDEIVRDTDRDNFLSAEEAKEYGLVDEVIAHR
jgi:ATP-dependent Clp protease protease subunit